ncbi:hypothetical protein GCM10010103_03260 [Streptomyces paradoxus]|uniref:UL36 very large tegument protein n=1 Tax=Streptomyces paradoxus TaxID=66375 RepID=A0A7W9WFZ2_9ACTN|nr:hypothetical protein [Streptomyces paradoxus]MBB6074795.1 hypothetical protein [Streptomyces paradoxus]
MAADQLPAEVGEFATYLDGLLARLDPSGGWCAVFWQRDPEGMRACLDGREMPPWDVVEALLQDLAGQYGPGGAGPETDRARALHAAAVAAYDGRPGGRDALGDRLDVMLREQRYAAERQAALARHLTSATTREQADALRLDLAWARDDHERAAARCAELRARMAHLDRRDREAAPGAWDDAAGPGGAGAAVPSTAADRYDHGASWAATGAAGLHDAEASGAGRHSGSRAAPGGVTEHGRPGTASSAGADAPARHEAVPPEDRWNTPQHPGGPAVPGGVAADGGLDGFRAPAAPAGAGPAARYGAVAPDASRHDPQHPGSPAVPGGVAAGGGPGAFGAPAADSTPAAPEPPAPEPPTPKQRKRRRGSARFAGMADEDVAAVAVPPAADLPVLPAPAPASSGRTLRGARFAGAAEEAVVERPARETGAAGAADLAEVGRTVDLLARLRGEGRSGEAHALLTEVASWEPARFPLLAERLHLAGLDADWQTLLWEAASLPAGRLVAAADALVEAGRAEDGRQMLRQGIARPPGEVGDAVLGLTAEGRHREVRVLLDAYVRARTPEEAARSAEPEPRRLVPLLLEAARGVSDERHWDLVHALRVAGFAA